MKRLLWFIVACLFSLFFCIQPAFAEKDYVKMIDDETGIAHPVSDSWRFPTAVEQKALDNPGIEFPVDISISGLVRDGFFHRIKLERYSEVVLYEDNKIQKLEKTGEREGEKVFIFRVVLLLAGMVIMALFNLQVLKGELFIALIIPSTLLVIVSDRFQFQYTQFHCTQIYIPILMFLSLSAAFIALISKTSEFDDPYKKFSKGFYILMGIALFA